jgi:hypothetical protein
MIMLAHDPGKSWWNCNDRAAVARLGKRRLPVTQQSARLAPVVTVNRLVLLFGIAALLPVTALINSCKVAKFI